ncbi:hypothetical protein PVAP13_1NG125519 [Panicum virgatum]|uniref:Uncharacterized protein n=1 Tax=Panicum virgatum TaxID=38727 RepID=A0A8T0WJ58_PANVG|nr:hypothetical protein PVAP13_1NG125519 [Panicum virgatum]
MEGTTTAGGSSLPPETIIVPSPRGQKRGAPDDDEAAGVGADRGSPRRAAGVDAVLGDEEEPMEFMEEEEESTMEYVEEEDDEEELEEPEDDATPARELFDFLRVHSGPADDATAPGSSSTAGQEPVDLTLRLGVGPLADHRGGTVDTTLSHGEDDGGCYRLHGETVIRAMPLGAASNAEPDLDDDVEFARYVAADLSPSDVPSPPPPPEDLTVDDSAIDCFASTAGDGSVGSAADDAAGRRPSTVLDLNKPCPSEYTDGAPAPSRVPDPAPADVDRAADVDERPAVEQRHQSRALFIDFFCSPAQDVRAPGVLTADSS